MKVVIVVLRENAETDFVKRIFFQGFQGLLLKLFILQVPYITGSSNTMIRLAILVSQVIGSGYADWTVVVCGRGYSFKTAADFFCAFCLEGRFDFKCICIHKRWHKSYFINTVSIIETVYCFLLIFTLKSSLDPLVAERIPLLRPLNCNLKGSPFFHSFCIVHFHNQILLLLKNFFFHKHKNPCFLLP